MDKGLATVMDGTPQAMLNVCIPRTLKQRLKLASIGSDQTIQKIVEDALTRHLPSVEKAAK